MARLSDITIATTEVPVGGTTITVRGVNLADVMIVMRDFAPEAALVFAQAQKGEFSADDAKGFMSLLTKVVMEVPDAVAALIALANDEYDDGAVRNARRLPVGDQVECLLAIWNLTFTSEGALEKLLESVTKAAMVTTRALQGVTTTSTSGSGISEEAQAFLSERGITIPTPTR